MKKAGLFISPKRGFFQITDKGKEILSQNPSEINLKFLNQFPEFIEFKTTKKDNDKSEPEIIETLETTPQESIEFGYQKIRKELELELLNRVKSCSPDFFERLVVDLLVKMGYGGSRRDAGRAIGKSGDGGIDGIIKEDKLGLDIVYVQAKRWDNTVVGLLEFMINMLYLVMQLFLLV